MAKGNVKNRGVIWRSNAGGTQVHPQTKARGAWWIRYADQHGHLRREKVGPKGLALDLYRKRKTEIREGRYFPPTKKRAVLFDEIANDFLVYSKANKKSATNDEARMERLLTTFGGKPVADVGTQDVERLRAELRKDLSPATVNRHLALLKTTFNRAMKAEPPRRIATLFEASTC